VPYASDAQRKKFHVLEEEGKISPETVHEFDEASKGKKLPEHVHHTSKDHDEKAKHAADRHARHVEKHGKGK